MYEMDTRAHRPLRWSDAGLVRTGVTLTALLVAASAGATSASAAVNSVGGGGYAVSANVNALVAPVTIGALPTVSLPPEGGGPYAESLVSANAGGLAPIGVATVSTEGNSGIGSVSSFSSVADVGIAGLVSASTARSRCTATTDGAEGSASVVDLVVAGITMSTDNAGPNTTIALPVGTVTINEQRRSGLAGLTVNAVRISLDAFATGDIVLAQSRCTVTSSSARSKTPRRVRKVRRS